MKNTKQYQYYVPIIKANFPSLFFCHIVFDSIEQKRNMSKICENVSLARHFTLLERFTFPIRNGFH